MLSQCEKSAFDNVRLISRARKSAIQPHSRCHNLLVPSKLTIQIGNYILETFTRHSARGENRPLTGCNSPECHMCDELGLVELWDTHVSVHSDSLHCPSLQPYREQEILFDSPHFLSLNRLLQDDSLRQDLEIATNYENSEFSSLTSSGARFPNSLCNCYQITDLTAVL